MYHMYSKNSKPRVFRIHTTKIIRGILLTKRYILLNLNQFLIERHKYNIGTIRYLHCNMSIAKTEIINNFKNKINCLRRLIFSFLQN